MLARSLIVVRLLLVLCLPFVGTAEGLLGFDTSTWEHPWPQQGFECLRTSGNASFLIVEGYRSKADAPGGAPGGHVVTTTAQTVRNAVAAGFTDVNLYHFPDTASDPVSQVRDTVRYLLRRIPSVYRATHVALNRQQD